MAPPGGGSPAPSAAHSHHHQPPSEETILSEYLLLPAGLPGVVTLEEFASFFPRAQRSSPRVRALYRDLQQQRNAAVAAAAEGIAAQVRQGRALRRQVVRERRAAAELGGEEDRDDEVEIERTVCFCFSCLFHLPSACLSIIFLFCSPFALIITADLWKCAYSYSVLPPTRRAPNPTTSSPCCPS